MITLLTIDSELTSAKWLGVKDTVTYLPSDRSDNTFYKNKIVIRWGNSRLYKESYNSCRYRDFKHRTNKSAAIANNCNKFNTLEKFSKIVDCPRIFHTKVPADVYAVFRPKAHAGGSDFVVKKGPFEVFEGMYATEFIKTEVEYRVWFCGERTMFAKRFALKHNTVEEFNCRSQWGYSGITTHVPEKLHNDTLKAAKVVDLDFGAADVLFHGGKYYFLELNSAPTIDTPMIANFYRKNMATLLKTKFPTMFAADTINELNIGDPKPVKA